MTIEVSEYRLSENEMKNLITETSRKQADKISEFSKDLLQTKDASEHKTAWIAAIVPLHKYIEDKTQYDLIDTKSDKISVKFLLKNGHTFWRYYQYPREHFDESHSFYQLIEKTGHGIENIKQAVGEPIPIRYNKNFESWSVDIEEPEEQTDTQETFNLLVDKFVHYLLPLYLGVLVIIFSIVPSYRIFIIPTVLACAVLLYHNMM